jgi:arylsulfatase A-like enzyme
VLEALEKGGMTDRTIVILSSDHGESLGEHDYYFDHGEDLFDPCLRIPLIVHVPYVAGGRTSSLASTLDFLPTILDAVKVSYPPDLAGRSLLADIAARRSRAPERLYAQNERSLAAAFDHHFKTVATPESDGWRYAFFDRQADPSETRPAAKEHADAERVSRRELELYLERAEKEWGPMRARTSGEKGVQRIPPEVCAQLHALGYLGTPGCEK